MAERERDAGFIRRFLFNLYQNQRLGSLPAAVLQLQPQQLHQTLVLPQQPRQILDLPVLLVQQPVFVQIHRWSRGGDRAMCPQRGRL